MKKVIITLIIATFAVASFPIMAQAHLTGPTLGPIAGPGSLNKNDNPTSVMEVLGLSPLVLTELWKWETDDSDLSSIGDTDVTSIFSDKSRFRALLSGYTTEPSSNAIVKWDLTGTGYELAAVVAKDGKGTDGIYWQAYGVSAGELIQSSNWDSGSALVFPDLTHEIVTPPGSGAISHITAYGYISSSEIPEVPEPSLGLLLGISLIGLVGAGAVRRIKQKAVVKVKS